MRGMAAVTTPASGAAPRVQLMRVKSPGGCSGHTRSVHMPITTTTTFRRSCLAALAAGALLAACGDKAAQTPSVAESEFHALVAACTSAVAARPAVVHPDGPGRWAKTGYSAALVQGDVERTDVAATPYVGKIVIKDNHARAVADTEAAASAITLAPMHLLANRTHTFIYSHDGTRWQWQNGMRLDKVPSLGDTRVPLTLADVQAADDGGLAGCIPR